MGTRRKSLLVLFFRKEHFFRLIYAVCLLGATCTHVWQLIAHGLVWDYGGVPKLSAAFWTSLAFLDPAAALLLCIRPRAGLVLTGAIIVSDVIHNTWIGFRLAPFREAVRESAHNWPYLAQITFMIFVLATLRIAWKALKP